MVPRILKLSFIIAVAWLTSACGGSSGLTNNTGNGNFDLMENEKLYAAQETGQIIVDGDELRIGIGNIRQETYTNQVGVELEGFTTGLWLFFREQPDLDQQMRAYEGQSLQVGDYKIRVVEINQQDRMVVLGVTPP